ncbi:hypothetical protein [Microbacterium sp. 179-I 3D4 NHS]|uniref:hypothetical protein n=1 Tax=Microbacterium sp. 179-I 3D4 NHS TaxID=3142381 RepID=UPI0039A263D3
MTEQTATHISIAVAIALVIVSLAYGLQLGRLRRPPREKQRRSRSRGLGTIVFFSAAMPGGIVFLWNRPLFEPLLQVLLLCIVPALIGFGIHTLLAPRRPHG